MTTPARTIADLRRAVPETQYRKALRQAEFLGLDLGEIESDHAAVAERRTDDIQVFRGESAADAQHYTAFE